MDEIHHRIVNSIRKINKNEWDSVFGSIPEGYEFYHTLEKSDLKEFSFYYLLLYRDGHILFVAPLFVADFYLDIVLKGFIKNVIGFIRHFVQRFFILKTLFCGSPFGENAILGITKDFKDTHILIDELVKGMRGFCKENKISFTIFKDFLNENSPLLDSLKQKGFLKVDSFPSVRIELNFNSLEEYFKSLSPSTRKDLRRKIKEAYTKANIEIRIVDSVEDTIDDIYRLYLNTYRAGKIKFEFLTKEFFINVSKDLRPHIKYFLYYVNGNLSAFNLCFVYNDLLIDKFIGFDYDIAHQYSLYFVSWCFNIEWCLKNSIRFYQVGQTDYFQKIKLGGSLIPLYAYVKHNNFFFNLIIRLLTIFLKPGFPVEKNET
ncbi:MAG: GNAT family N-acetyltransferase [Thermodesulfobacteriota bacterium]